VIRSVLDGYSPACVAPQNRTLSLQEQKLRHRDCFVGINDPLENCSEKGGLFVSLTSVNRDNYWRIESSDEAWVVTAAFAMPAWQYRQLLAAVMRQSPRFTDFVCRWVPELDPYALALKTGWTEIILCWNKELGAIAVLVPAELSENERQSSTKLACDFLAFICSLIGNPLLPLPAFIWDDDENDSWVASAVAGDLRLC